MNQKLFRFLFAFSILAVSNNAFAQGCVAIRSTGGICTMDHAGHTVEPSK
jgi:hypothetical protein